MIVLVVSDDVHERETLKRGLVALGHLAVSASSEDALRYLAGGGCADVLLVDVTAAGSGRPRFIDSVLRDRPGIRVVAIAGLATPPELARLEARGVLVLRRPFGLSDLARSISPPRTT